MNNDARNLMAANATGGVVVANVADCRDVGVSERSKAYPAPLDASAFPQFVEVFGEVVPTGVSADDRIAKRRAEHGVIRLEVWAAQHIEQGDCFRPERGGLLHASFEPDTINAHHPGNGPDFLPEQVRAILAIHSGVEGQEHARTQPAVTERVIEQFAKIVGTELSLAVFAFGRFARCSMLGLVGDFELAPVQRKRTEQGVIDAPLEHRANGADVTGNGWRAVILPECANGSEVCGPEIRHKRFFASLGNEPGNATSVFFERVVSERAGLPSDFAIGIVGAGQVADADYVTSELFDFRLARLDENAKLFHGFGLGTAAMSEVNDSSVNLFDVAVERLVMRQMVGDSSRHGVERLSIWLFPLRIGVIGCMMESAMKSTEKSKAAYRPRTDNIQFTKPIQTFTIPGESVESSGIVADISADADAIAPKVVQRLLKIGCTESAAFRIFSWFESFLDSDPLAKEYSTQQAARVFLQKANRCKLIKRATRCSNCFQGGRINGHHPDYRQPHVIIWLCQSCHSSAHRRPGYEHRIARLAKPRCAVPSGLRFTFATSAPTLSESGAER